MEIGTLWRQRAEVKATAARCDPLHAEPGGREIPFADAERHSCGHTRNAFTEVERPFRMGLAVTLQRRGEWGRRTLDEPDC